MRVVRGAAGLLIALLSAIPAYRLLTATVTGPTGASVVANVDLQAGLLWSGLLVALIPAIIAARMVDPDGVERLLASAKAAITRWPSPVYAGAMALLSAAIAFVVTWLVFEARPNLLDAVAQLTHARYVAAGMAGGPPALAEGFWHLGNTVVTPSGWYSQYPPGHVILLAAGLVVEAPWLPGVLAAGGIAALSVFTFERLLPERVALARLAALGVAVSPFLIAHAAAYMNHATAAFFGLLALYCAIRARDGAAAWALSAGASTAMLAAIRPLSAVVMAVVIAAAVWPVRPSPGRWASRAMLAIAGGLPLLAAQLWYNREAFGGILVFGYTAGWGASHGLGFHADPWGNPYGPVQALLYTSADLVALNLNLLEGPLPAVTLAGIFLMVHPRALTAGERIIVAASLAPVAANLFYWHHGWFMGPRMLAEWAPMWIALTVVACAGLLERVPRGTMWDGRVSPRAGALGFLGAAIAGMLWMGPQRLASYAAAGADLDVSEVPPQSIVFVHGSWESRLASRLARAGWRLDMIETALRQNPTCLVQQHLDDHDARATNNPLTGASVAGLPAMDLVPSRDEYLPRLEIAPGSRMRHDTTAAFPERCRVEAEADRLGALDAGEYFWRGSLPGLEDERPLFARDLGPELNRALLARYGERTAWLYAKPEVDRAAVLTPYDDGMRALWSPVRP